MTQTLIDIHTHTIVSGHAFCTLNEMVQEAQKHHLVLFGITEHGPAIPGTCHPVYFRNLHVVPRQYGSMRLLLGAELNIIDYEGNVDITDPYVLGISSGSSLGGAISFILGWDVFYFGVTIPALITGLLTLFVILGISKMSRRRSIETLLLVGIAINFLISAVITLLVVMHQREMHKIYFWTMGSLASISWSEVLMMTVMTIICVIPFFFYSKDLNIMQMGEDVAKNLGVNTKRVAYITLIFSSLLIATAVSCCGVIGFIGLIIPHVSRMLFGNNMRSMFTYSLILGAFFLLIADTLARTLAIPAELPVGSITALAGAPYFLFLLLRQKKV